MLVGLVEDGACLEQQALPVPLHLRSLLLGMAILVRTGLTWTWLECCACAPFIIMSDLSVVPVLPSLL